MKKSKGDIWFDVPTLMTLAPSSAKRQVTKGAATACSKLTTVMWERSLGMGGPVLNARTHVMQRAALL